jgi:predicted negative regulator of RcsB-dependent stress response
MKSAHRHELETNALAHGLEAYIDRTKPYFGKVAFGILAFVAILFAWSYLSNSTSARRGEAWDAYNLAVGSGSLPNLEVLRRAAEENPGTNMQRMADATWADGQVYVASRTYITNRAAAKEALNKAAGAYQSVIATSDDERLTNRARLGLARVYEMQGDLDKAKAQYGQVTGSYAVYAKAQAERLSKPESKDTYAWLATAQPPVPKAPMGPGTPGQKPEFSPGEIALPNGGTTETTPGGDTKNASETFDNLLKDMQKDSKSTETGDRYKNETPADSKSNDVPAKSDAGKSDTKTEAPSGEKSAK